MQRTLKHSNYSILVALFATGLAVLTLLWQAEQAQQSRRKQTHRINPSLKKALHPNLIRLSTPSPSP